VPTVLAKRTVLGSNLSKGNGFPMVMAVYQQDVLLPAFMAAYTGKAANSFRLLDDRLQT